MSTPTPASLVRKGKLSLKVGAGAAVFFNCDPTSVVLAATGGDTPDPVEPLCGDVLQGAPGPTTWAMNLTSLMRFEEDATTTNSLVLFALANDGKTADFVWTPGENTLQFTGQVRIVPISIGGAAGGTYPTQDVVWPMLAPPVSAAPAALAAKTT